MERSNGESNIEEYMGSKIREHKQHQKGTKGLHTKEGGHNN